MLKPKHNQKINTDRANQALSRRSFLKLASASMGAALTLAACDIMREEEEATQLFDLPLSNRQQYPDVPGPKDLPPPGVLGFFTLEEARTVEALTATIIPGTPEDPGAREAGVVLYIDGLLWFDRGFGTRTYYSAPFALSYEGDAPPSDSRLLGPETLWIPKEMMSRFGWQSILTPREYYRMGVMAVDSFSVRSHGSAYINLTESQQEEVMAALADDEFDPIGGLPSSDFFNLLRNHTIEGMFSDPAYRGNRDLVGWKLVGYPGAQRAYTPLDMRDENFHRQHRPQSLAELHPFNPGEITVHPNEVLPVSGSGTPGVPTPDVHEHR